MIHRRIILFLAVGALSITGCASSQSASAPTVENLRARCATLVAGPDVEYPISVATIERSMSRDELDEQHSTSGYDDFYSHAEDADAFWWYDDSSQEFEGYRTGEAGLLATKGCTVVAQATVIIFN